jgi:hypothetical protein
MAGIDDAVGVQFRNGDLHDHILTDHYLPVLADALNNVTTWYDMIGTRAPKKTAGKFMVWPVHKGRNYGSNAMDSRGYLPDPGAQSYDTHTLKMSPFYGRIKIDGETKDRAQTDIASYLDAVETEMEGAITDSRIDWQRQACNDGSGRLAEVTTNTSGTIVCQLHSGVSVGGAGLCTSEPTQHMAVGMRLQFMTEAGATPVTRWVTAVTNATTITVSITEGGATEGTGIAVGDWICRVSREGSTSLLDGAYRNEMMGLEGIYDDRGVLDGNGLASGQTGSYDTTETDPTAAGFQGILATSANEWNQAVLLEAASLRDCTDDLLQIAVSDAERLNNGKVDLLLSSFGVYNVYLSTLVADKRFNNTLEIHGGHKVLDFNGIGFVKDKDIYLNRVYGINMDVMNKHEVTPLHWLQDGSSIWSRVTDKDAYEAAYKLECNNWVDVRQRTGFMMTDLNES